MVDARRLSGESTYSRTIEHALHEMVQRWKARAIDQRFGICSGTCPACVLMPYRLTREGPGFGEGVERLQNAEGELGFGQGRTLRVCRSDGAGRRVRRTAARTLVNFSLRTASGPEGSSAK